MSVITKAQQLNWSKVKHGQKLSTDKAVQIHVCVRSHEHSRATQSNKSLLNRPNLGALYETP